MPINAMGKANKKWGVCGFTSAFYAMYTHSDITGKAKLSDSASVKTRVLAEIKTYLAILRSEAGSAHHIAKINAFCSSFPDYGGFTVAEYVRKINEVPVHGQLSEDFSIGMPPETIQHYLRTVCGFRSATYVCDPLMSKPLVGSTKPELIIGVAEAGSGMTHYGGLCHYMYQKDGKIYSWGKKFSTVQDAADWGAGGANWNVCLEIELTA